MLLRLAEHVFGLRASSLENPSTSLANPAKWLREFVGGGSAAGVAVNEEKALGQPVAYACTNLLSRQQASLPLHVFRKNGKFSEPAPDHWTQPLLADAPNMLQTAFAWRQQMMVHALLWGNHYSVIDLAPNGDVSFLPLLPWNVRVQITSDGRRKVYIARLMDGTEKVFREDQILHIPALTPNGMTGVSPVRTLKNMYGLAIAAEDFGSRFFANDARPGVILETPGSMNEEAQQNLVESLYKKYTGAENRWKVLVLEEGAKMHTVQMPHRDAQFLETRLAQDTQICGQFGVPPHMVGIVEKVSSWGSGIYEMTAGFVKYTLRPWCECIEQEFNRKLFVGTEFFAKHNLEGILRGDYKTRMEGHEIAIRTGVLLPDEGRALEDREPLPDGLGKIPFISANLQTIDNAKQAKAVANGVPAGGDPMDAEEKQLLRDLATEVRAGRAPAAVTAPGTTVNATFNLPESMTHKLDIPAPQVKVDVAAPNVTVSPRIEVAAPEVTVQNRVEPTPVTVNVEAPQVTVENTVSPTPVEVKNDVRVEQQPVEVNVHLPARKSTSEVERDKHGAIKKVTTTEKDA